MSPLHASHLIIISLFMINELTLVNLVSSKASIDRGNSNISQEQRDAPTSQPDSTETNHDLYPTHNQQPQRQQQQQDQQQYNQPFKSEPVPDDIVILNDLSAEENDPLYEVKCPIDEIITRRPIASTLTEPAIKKKFDLIKQRIEITWYKDNALWTHRENGNMFEKTSKFTVAIYQFRVSDAAKYTCIVDYEKVPNSLEKYFEFHAGASFDIIIPESTLDIPPYITHQPGHLFAARGQNVTFTCNTTIPTLSHQTTRWFKSCSHSIKNCDNEFMAAYNKSDRERSFFPLKRYMIRSAFNQVVLDVINVTEERTGLYACVVENNKGIDIRRGRLDLIDSWPMIHNGLQVGSSTQSMSSYNSWVWLTFFVFAGVVAMTILIGFMLSMSNDKKRSAPLIDPIVGQDLSGKDMGSRRRLPNIEAPDIYNTGKSIDGFISGHFHQATGHVMAQSICSNLLNKATPSISSANSNQSDEASSSWGKSSGDNCKAFYTPPSNRTATTAPLYDHPPSTGTLKHCSTFFQSACINNPTYGFLRPENDAAEWSFPRRNLDRLDKIGEGQFGEVWRYVAHRDDGVGDIVAVKQLKSRAGLGDRERLELIAEIEIMKSVNDHPNVIKLLHYCVDDCGPTLLIMEYAENGKLQTYLRRCRQSKSEYRYTENLTTNPKVTSKELIKFTYHIAKGMEYVASQGIVHRDLASRNILVSNDRVCKVADFGFARRVNDECAYERTTTNPVPVKWMAPEALVGNKFTSKSDVFSLGILMWEIVTLGATPYQELTSEGVYKKVTTGGRLERPSHCKDEFYNLMAQCWLHDPVLRPSFKSVARQLEKLLLSENDYIELDQYPEHAYYNILNTAEKEVVKLDT